VETSDTSFEANLRASFLDNNVFVLVLLVSVVKFRDLLEDPECLAVQLFLQVHREDILESVLLAH